MKTILLSLLALSLLNCSLSPSAKNRQPSEALEITELPDYQQWTNLINFTNTVSLNDPQYTLASSTGGTSVYVILKKADGLPVGAILPQNSATILSGEILSFHLARAFGVASLYQPGFFRSLQDTDLKTFTQFVNNTEAKSSSKKDNKKMILENIAKNPQGIKTIFKPFGTKPQDYDSLVVVEKNKFNSKHVLSGSKNTVASMLSCNGPQPSQQTMIQANGGSTTEYEAVKQLSAILLIDALTVQWDRFSGGNLQTLTENKVVKFIAFDNGGTWGAEGYTTKSLGLVTRFDRKMAEEILKLHASLNLKTTDFYGITTDAAFLHAFGIEQFPQALPLLKKSLAQVAKHLEANKNCYF